MNAMLLLTHCPMTHVTVNVGYTQHIFEAPINLVTFFTKREVTMMPGYNPSSTFGVFIDLCVGVVPWNWTGECNEALRMLLDIMPLDYVMLKCRVLLERRFGTDKVTALAVALATGGIFEGWNDDDYLDDAFTAWTAQKTWNECEDGFELR